MVWWDGQAPSNVTAPRSGVIGGRASGFLALGWREVSADVEYEDGTDEVDADLSFSGPYLGFVLGF